MRLHRLEVTAFGPFADHQVVDFDRLSQAGLFLLHGPTGAGKTSVLDAICFALYGRVPGVRGSTGRLRSDHAPAEVAPEVVCDFSVAGRRFEVTRSPEWQRPKKRGTGTVREQAHVVVRERVGTEWTGLTNRVDEAADLLQTLIGLGAEQFTKLILLPQGDFAAFLRASAEERRPLLQKLFGTDRFAEVERWLADRRRELEHHIQAANATTARLFARAQEARLAEPPTEPGATEPGPAEPGPAKSGPAKSGPDVPSAEAAGALVSAWAEAARTERRAAHLQVTAAEHDHDAARLAAETAQENQRRQQRRVELTTELAVLHGGAADQDQRRAVVTAAAQARVVVPLVAELKAAAGQLEAAQAREEAAAATARAADEDPDTLAPQRETELREELGSLAELLRAQLDLRRLDDQHEAAEQQIEAAEQDRERADRELAELTARQSRLAAERGAAELIAVTGPDRDQARARARAVAVAVLEQEQAERERTQAQDGLRTAIDAHQVTVAAGQELRARRLDGMAAELAAGLAADVPCPVCGSCQHPVPAARTAPAVTERAQQRAEKAEKEALAARELAQDAVSAAAQRWAGLQAITEGLDAESAATRLRDAESRVAQARTAGEQVQQFTAELETITGRLERAREQQSAATDRATSGREALAELAGRRSDLRDRLDRARGDDADVQSRHRRLTDAAEAVAGYLTARRLVQEATDRLERARAAADRAAEAAGFPDRAAAVAAIRPEAERERLAALVEEHDAQTARLSALLAELDLSGPPDPGSPAELEILRTAQASARAADEAARARHTLAAHAVQALTGLGAELEAHAAATAPLRHRFAALDSVSKCVEGTGGDNALRMRLSSYVLAARLEQVADAASIRLAAMSGGRYLLVHTDGPSRGGARSGLGLAVVDGWTGVQRDPASLSGGETFCTSLALALGLADVVQAESGGSVIETLLVDEGFGSLDEQTVDEVMDVLDGLRSAGRSVGLVSHVADLRDRIPAQLRVLKTRTGSRLIA